MYADTEGPLCPYFHDFSQEVQQLVLEELFQSHPSPYSMTENSFISEYDMGGEGDLFRAPDTIFEELIISLDSILDPMTASISTISFADQESMPTVHPNVGNSELVPNDELFNKVLYEIKSDILEDNSTETQLINELMDSRVPASANEIHHTEEKHLTDESVFQKSVSTGSLNCSMVPISDSPMTPSYLDFLEFDFGAAYGMRRAFSEGDIKSSIQWPGAISEDRQQKLSRYRTKKLKRNFRRKIKYACRKALADTQPRIRGRFVSKGK